MNFQNFEAKIALHCALTVFLHLHHRHRTRGWVLDGEPRQEPQAYRTGSTASNEKGEITVAAMFVTHKQKQGERLTTYLVLLSFRDLKKMEKWVARKGRDDVMCKL